MARWALPGAAALIVILVARLWLDVHLAHVTLAEYELEYLRTDEPAYHATLFKKYALARGTRSEGLLSHRYQRQTASRLRLGGLVALAGFFVFLLGRARGFSAFAMFLTISAAGLYFVRLDSWMDAVCYSFAGLAVLALGRGGGAFLGFASGVFFGLAADSKLTSLLMIIPAAALFLPKNLKSAAGIILGVLAGVAISSPAWVVDPAAAFRHVLYWRASNAELPELPGGYPIYTVVSAVPAVFLALAAWSLMDVRKNPEVFRLAVLGLAPLVFFTLYRAVPADGLRHYFGVLPFLSGLASWGWFRCGWPARIFWAALWIGELWIRTGLLPQ